MVETHKKSLKDVGLSSDAIKRLYKDMLLIRRFEEKAGQLYGRGLIGGFCHLYIGQEAIVVGLQSLLKEVDSVITGYRDHGHMLACDMDAGQVMAELTGRIDGYSRGKGGSMHMFSREKNFYGGHGIVGAQASLGTGLAFAHQYNEDGGVCLAYMGDGAANQGQFYESLNMAALWNLPVVYIIENNQYAMGTSTKRHGAGPSFHGRATGFGVANAMANGMDVFDVIEAGKVAIDHVRSGKGPYVLELDAYRYRGHSMSDPAKYRTKDEVQDYKDTRDPIVNLKNFILRENIINDAALKELEKEVKAHVQEAARFAEESPIPPESELYTDVLIEDMPTEKTGSDA